MAEVIKFTGMTTIPEPSEQVLEKAKAWDLETVIVLGTDSNGDLQWGGNFSDVEAINLLLDAAKFELLTEVFQK